MKWRRLSIAVAMVCVAAGIARAQTSDRARTAETERVAAFARLYGVVRYFHPSDAAQEIDWTRFAIYGAERSRRAADLRELQRELTALFAPFTTGIEIVPAARAFAKRAPTPSNQPLVAWRHRGLSLGTGARGGTYASGRTRRETPEAIRGVTKLMQTVEGASLRGRPVRIRAMVRAIGGDERSGAALWLRVDRPKRQTGFLDEMKDRPIRVAEWNEYEVAGRVDDDAENISFGMMAWGNVVAGFDAVALETQNVDGVWEPIKIPDAGFEAAQTAWKKSGNSPNATMLRKLEDAPQGKAWMQVQGKSDFNGPFNAPLTPDHFADFELGAGLKARVPLALTDATAKVSAKQRPALDAFKRILAEMPEPKDSAALSEARQADIIVAWNVYRHFYPYLSDIQVDWDARLMPFLESVSAASGRAEELSALRRLVAEARDGHGLVVDTLETTKRAYLPITVEPVGDAWVVTASSVPDQVQPGDVIDAVNGVPIAEYAARTQALMSGSPQWTAWRAAQDLTSAPVGSQVNLSLRRDAELLQVQLAYEASSRVMPRHLDALLEVAPGVWYVDLTRAKVDAILAQMTVLTGAKGVIFDLRGYPVDSGASALLPHFVLNPEQAKWMHVPQYVGPFGEQAGFSSLGWNLKPEEPHFAGKVFFLTDRRAISYAESVLGYVADEKLGEIIGAPTAGTNGNTNVFVTPTGYRITFTGMRVTRHDGSPFHLIGVQPTIPVTPTVAGIRAGQDEVLQKALDLAQAQ
jgi:Peptidase family S41